jgi:hypothetical protein
MFERLLKYVQGVAKDVPERIRKALFTYTITRGQLWKIKAEMDNFRLALDMARNPIMPNRRYLYAIYREVELDDQVISQTRIACATVQRAPFEVVKGGAGAAMDEKLTDLFRRPWFNDMLEVLIKTEFWGHSLMEFDPRRDARGEFTAYYTIPRDHVRPEYGDVLRQQSDSEGILFRNNPDYKYTLEVGRPDDLGLYHVIAIPAIRKKYADTDWSVFSERFGSPFLTIKTASRDPKELDAKERMAKDFGSNGYAILDDQDELSTIIANHNGTAHLTFKDRMALADDQIAKIINGQTGASDEKAYVGSAEVHERILNDFNFARMTRLQYWINYVLLPFLRSHGYAIPEEARFEFTELRKREPKETTSPDDDTEPGESKPAPRRAQKKSPRMSAFARHYDEYLHRSGCDCPACRAST